MRYDADGNELSNLTFEVCASVLKHVSRECIGFIDTGRRGSKIATSTYTYVHIYIYIYLNTHTFIYIHTNLRGGIRIYIHTYIYTHIFMHMRVYE